MFGRPVKVTVSVVTWRTILIGVSLFSTSSSVKEIDMILEVLPFEEQKPNQPE